MAYSGGAAPGAPMEFGYWKIRGLGAAARRSCLGCHGVSIDWVVAAGEEWFKERKPAILAMNPLANLPYLVDGDNCICQTNAILSYLGDKFDLNGSTEAQKIRTQETGHSCGTSTKSMMFDHCQPRPISVFGAFYEAFKALPTLKAYFASDAYKMDVFHGQ
eukprot:Skav229503  [mRNA]  locus=scaffold2455:204804:210297:- [translate_table: standard]